MKKINLSVLLLSLLNSYHFWALSKDVEFETSNTIIAAFAFL